MEGNYSRRTDLSVVWKWPLSVWNVADDSAEKHQSELGQKYRKFRVCWPQRLEMNIDKRSAQVNHSLLLQAVRKLTRSHLVFKGDLLHSFLGLCIFIPSPAERRHVIILQKHCFLNSFPSPLCVTPAAQAAHCDWSHSWSLLRPTSSVENLMKESQFKL